MATRTGARQPKCDLLFLHGINDSQAQPWDVTLRANLGAAGFPEGLGPTHVEAPSYLEQLDGISGPATALPPRRYSPPAAGSDTDLTLRRSYRIEHARLTQQLRGAWDRQVPPGLVNKLRKPAKKLAMRAKLLHQARNYAGTEQVRGAVLEKALGAVRQDRPVVIIAHSLGTLVALDLVRHLPKGVQVPLLVTVASPLPDPEFRALFREKSVAAELRGSADNYSFPYGVVDAWVNLFNPWDYVAGGAGLRSVAPEALDVIRSVGFGEHGLAPHLDSPDIGRVVGDALYGGAAPARHRRAGARLPDAAVFPLLMQHYGHCVEGILEQAEGRQGRPGDRYHDARAILSEQARASWGEDPLLKRAAHLVGQDVAQPLRDALGDDKISMVDAALLMASANPIEPFEIKVHGDILDRAQRTYLRTLALTTVTVEDVEGALRKAREPFLTFRQKVPKPVWVGLGAVGAAAAVAAPVVLMGAVAGGTLVGAAAVTSALAAFGPGGMIGGLLTLSFAVGGGTATSAAGLGMAMARSSPEGFQQSAVELLARAQLGRQMLVPNAGLVEWAILTEALAQAEAELFFVTGLSDPRAPSIRDLEDKIDSAKKALSWLLAAGFGTAQDG